LPQTSIGLTPIVPLRSIATNASRIQHGAAPSRKKSLSKLNC